jgi:hypothetical protein
VRLADLIETDVAVTPLNVGGISAQVGGTEVFHAVGPGSAVVAIDHGIICYALETVIQPLCLQIADVHLVGFAIAAHRFSF